MVKPKVDGSRLKQAIGQFGSLRKAVEVLAGQREDLKGQIATLTEELHTKESARVKCSRDLQRLKQAIEEGNDTLSQILDNITKYGTQYRLFEGFIAMLFTSPSVEKSLEDLAREILIWSQVTKETDWPINTLRWVFVQKVLGDHLHCYKCGSCGTKFLTSQRLKDSILGGICPVCYQSWAVKPDDSFLETINGLGDGTGEQEA